MRIFSFFVLIVIFLSCKDVNLKGSSAFNPIYYEYVIGIKKDSIGFGKSGDNVEFQKGQEKLAFRFNVIDSFFTLERNSDDITLKIFSHGYNTKSVIETLLIFDQKRELFFSFSTYHKFIPIGYNGSTGASFYKEDRTIVMNFISNGCSRNFKFPFMNMQAIDGKETALLIESQIGINNFLRICMGRFSDNPDKLWDIVIH